MTLRNRLSASGIVIIAMLVLVGSGGCAKPAAAPATESDRVAARLATVEADLVKSQEDVHALQARLDKNSASGWLNNTFTAASVEYRVPVDLLKAVSYAETRWVHRGSTPSSDGAFGLMGLRKGSTLPKAAQLLGLSAETLMTNPIENIRGGAMVLRKLYQEKHGDVNPPDNIDEWTVVLDSYSGLSDEKLRKQYTEEILKFVKGGVESMVNGEKISITAHK